MLLLAALMGLEALFAMPVIYLPFLHFESERAQVIYVQHTVGSDRASYAVKERN